MQNLVLMQKSIDPKNDNDTKININKKTVPTNQFLISPTHQEKFL
jgi:hypothetical protein